MLQAGQTSIVIFVVIYNGCISTFVSFSLHFMTNVYMCKNYYSNNNNNNNKNNNNKTVTVQEPNEFLINRGDQAW